MSEIKMTADIRNLHTALAFIRDEAEKSKMSSSLIDKLILATEEVLVNVIEHGSPVPGSDIVVRFESDPGVGEIKIVVRDKGIPFNPIEKLKETAPPSFDGTEDRIGGYGIFLYTNLLDHVEYKREDDQNVLTLIKRM